MTIAFERPVGAPADVKELEYVSALSQTSLPELRSNGSLFVEDIVIYLGSRHGIRVDPEVVQKVIMTDLAGDLSSDPTHAVDICQLASLLLLPHFKKVADSNDEEKIKALFGKGLDIMLAELPPDERWYPGGYHPGAYPVLSVELMQELLAANGEFHVPPQILEVLVASVGGEGQVLDPPTLMKALTSDLANYDVSREALASTHYEDAIQPRPTEKTGDEEENHDSLETTKDEKDDLVALKRGFTASTIDFTAETYGNKIWVSLTWVLAILLFFAFMLRVIRKVGRPKCKSLSGFTCKLVTGIVQWLILFLQLSVLGFAFISLVNMGNSVYNKKNFVTVGGIFVGMATIVLTTIVTFFVLIQSNYLNTKKYDGHRNHYDLLELTRLLVPTKILKSIPHWKFFIRQSTIKLERSTKLAASRKVETMVGNAMVIHEACSQPLQSGLSSSNRMGSALLAYQSKEHDVEPCGGIVWAWKKMYDGSLYSEEGVWLHARLIASNIAQLFVAVTIAVFWGLVTFQVVNVKEEPTMAPSAAPSSFYPTAIPTSFTLPPFYTQSPSPAPFTSSAPSPAPTDGFQFRLPEINTGISTGAFFAFAACLSVAAVYLPSAISTILKFRSGFFPSLRSKEFLQYRFAADQTTSLLGSAFWGALYASLSCWVLSGVVVYLLVSKNFRDFVVVLFAQVAGILVTIIMKVIVLLILRRYFFAAFYRKRPGAANVLLTVLECWNVGLSTLYMIVRSVILLLVTAIYIARVDTPLLAPGVGVIGPIILDAGPFAFRKDLLLHDAHRHPYVERLGLLYMMKLRYGESFATRAGSCWRLLFTMSVMPWLRKYRIRTYEESLTEGVTDKDVADKTTMRSFESLDAKAKENGNLEQEVTVLRDRIRELEEELARINEASFQDEPLEFPKSDD